MSLPSWRIGILPRLRNYSVTVKEWNDEIIFVRQVTPGASERSFGIQVARLAGLPDGVVGRAKQILASLEAEDSPTEPILRRQSLSARSLYPWIRPTQFL